MIILNDFTCKDNNNALPVGSLPLGGTFLFDGNIITDEVTYIGLSVIVYDQFSSQVAELFNNTVETGMGSNSLTTLAGGALTWTPEATGHYYCKLSISYGAWEDNMQASAGCDVPDFTTAAQTPLGVTTSFGAVEGTLDARLPKIDQFTPLTAALVPVGSQQLGAAFKFEVNDIRAAIDADTVVELIILDDAGSFVDLIFSTEYSFVAGIPTSLYDIAEDIPAWTPEETGQYSALLTITTNDELSTKNVNAQAWFCATDFTSAEETLKDVTTNYGTVTGTLVSGGGGGGGPATMSVGHFNLHTAAGISGYEAWLNDQVGSGRIKRIYYNEDLKQQVVVWETGE